MSHTYSWKDQRILINETHPYWKGRSNETRKTLRLYGDFVEKCLWTPKLLFLGIVKMSLWNPHSTSVSNYKSQSYLRYDSFVVISSVHVTRTISCNMKFDKYPFDRQVSMFIRQSSKIWVFGIPTPSFPPKYKKNHILSHI